MGDVIQAIRAKTAPKLLATAKVFNAESANYVVQHAIYGLLEVPSRSRNKTGHCNRKCHVRPCDCCRQGAPKAPLCCKASRQRCNTAR